MITFIVALIELAFIVWLLNAIEKRGYKKGHRDGYQEGHKAAREAIEFFQSLDWWGVAEREVTKTREVIRNEERWP